MHRGVAGMQRGLTFGVREKVVTERGSGAGVIVARE